LNALKHLFGGGDVGPRPQLRDLLPCPPGEEVLLVDGGTPPVGDRVGGELAGCVVQRLERHGPEGVPFDDADPRRLPVRDGGWSAVVLLDVVDRVLDPAHALRTSGDALAPGGTLLVVQQVAPDDIDARGAWNALARLRDARHTWTPTRRQVRALAGDAGLVRDGESLWEETAPMRGGVRPDTESLLSLYLTSLEAMGGVQDGHLLVRRLALVLRPRRGGPQGGR